MGNQTNSLKKQFVRYISVLSGILMLIVLAGCSLLEDGEQQADDFTRQIFLAYPELKEKKFETAVVKRVIDGDTFETNAGEKVRLIGVNTPETHGQSEYYGKEASEFSRQRLAGEKVYMFIDTGDKDRYGRLLRYIFVEKDPVMFNETLLLEGYANVMTVPPNVMFAEKFTVLEREARTSHKGLWNAEKQEASINYPCSDPKIKGNINSKKEKIYHVPGSRYYESTKAEEMFCSEEDAIAAGYRKPKGS